MEFIKKNIAFCLLIFICLLASAAGGYMAFAESGKVKSAQKKIKSAETQLNSFLNASPSPSDENVAASKQNVEALKLELKKIRDNLERGSRIKVSTDGVRVMASVQQYITEYQRRVEEHVNADGEPSPISTPESFGLGYGRYLDEGNPIETPELAAKLDKQLQVLGYILTKLIDSDPQGITEIQREFVEAGAGEVDKGFVINPAVSARVPGAIDTMAFSFTFTGYTDSLRAFLNNLAKFELPIVVRSIEVTRTAASATAAAAAPSNALDDIFGFGGGAAPVVEVEEAQKPVVSENLSSFTVVLEFIEIILPSDSEKNPS